MSAADRELLELAAKAAGVTVFSYIDDPLFGTGVNTGEVDVPLWNPLTDDGDALRLAVKLYIPIDFLADEDDPDDKFVQSRMYFDNALTESGTFTDPANDGDLIAATRRAIVLAAAAIGRAMP